MGRRAVAVVVLLVVLIGGYLVWKQQSVSQQLASGEVHCDGCMTPAEHARFLKENAGETPDGQSDRRSSPAPGGVAADVQTSRDEPPAQDGIQAGGSLVFPPSAAAGRSAGLQGSGSQAQPSGFVAEGGGAATSTSDTLPPNAQNGLRFGGTGPYQWYRQGNITWRVNTATGRSCIIYASMEEWRKSIVLSHGCGRNA